jgi:hypothetical protein
VACGRTLPPNRKEATMPRKRDTAQSVEQAPQTEREPGDEPKEGNRNVPNPRPWAHNNAAGVEMLEHRDPYERWLKFRDGKPPQEVINLVKDNGFAWNRDDQVWAKAVGYKTQAQDRLVADRTYASVVSLMLKAKGIEEPDRGSSGGTPF